MNGRISGAAALIWGLGAAANAWAMDSRAPSAEPPASLASPAPEAAAASSFAAPASAPADPTRLRAGAPSTFRLAPETATRDRLSTAASPVAAAPAASPESPPADPVLELHFADLAAAAATAPAVRVFLNKPDATPATSTEDPHYVGVVSFFPLSPGAEGSRFRLPLRETLGRIGPVAPETAEVTLVPVDLGAGAGTAPPFELRLLGMGLEAPR
ncbi:hypothetical protein [Neomegalonema sp.]|uniref:hypothetical protein n=1 Tax=Neomegalonema sp. TaxID=2039713 RepID=UPI002607D2EE|nr:hypothetical protein [Neomegalonema sp.]MDD2869611.1 hypothetical protein [Neomegalonema sp.]